MWVFPSSTVNSSICDAPSYCFSLKMLVYLLIALLLYPRFTLGQEEVKLNQGTLRGEFKYVAGKAIQYFLGIPYAQAPVGKLRLRPPQIHPGWQVRLLF